MKSRAFKKKSRDMVKKFKQSLEDFENHFRSF